MTIALYRRYRQALKITPFTGRFMPYDWSPLPHTLSAPLLIYSQMLDDYARELANSINDLTHREQRLRAWAAVLEDQPDKAVMEAHHALVGDVATVGLGLPYVIRSRFLFAVTHLSHQANQARQTDWRDDLPADDEIYMHVMDKAARSWRRYGRFKEKMQGIGGDDFRNATGNFRNLYQHRFSPRVGQGLTQIVTREAGEDGAVRYGIGGRAPLSIADVAAAILVQRDRSYAAFGAFQSLVEEQCKAQVAWSAP
ncbi:MAG: integrase [Brevundimonas sp.]|nr:integrase [Brevundimonas sp.]